MTLRVVKIPRKISGQNILNAMRYAASTPHSESFKFEQRQGRTSSSFQLIERRPTSAFRRRSNMPKHAWHDVRSVGLRISHGGKPIDSDAWYETGNLTLELVFARTNCLSEATAALNRLADVLPSNLEARTAEPPPFPGRK